ncbi:hypothetical protein [Serratia liquefaciens]|uniref:hypothetical protein n=1 Tax=Serratia liquefaciens TaxID=614 RepID=UPI000E03D915|nr:hypothetical protein [Serratia liquefaciens]MBF8107397.1 hypothetical protein [Serratia liquefaciens]SUI44925.1 Uncharacterised protein [Serratia liquefaciens]
MADEILPSKRISELPPASSLNDADIIPLTSQDNDVFNTKSGTLALLRGLLNFDNATLDVSTGLSSTKSGQIFHVWDGAQKLYATEYVNNAGTANPTGDVYPSTNLLIQLAKRLTWNDTDPLYAFLFQDELGHSALGIRHTGELRAAKSRLFKAVADEITVKNMLLTPDKNGVLWRWTDSLGRDAVRFMADGRFLTIPTLKVFNGNTLVSKRVGSIKLGDRLKATPTATGVEINVVGGGDGGPLGKIASQYTGPKKLNDPESWGNRRLVLSAGGGMVEGVSGSPSVFGFWVINTDRIPNEQRINGARYYAYWSTDHGSAGGVFMATANDPLGPWTPQGRIYLDPSSQQTETPCVVWDRHKKNWRMFYHVQEAKYGPNDSLSAKGVQSTLSAYSDDGVNWTKDPYFIIDKWDQNVGDGHTGYFYVSETPDGYIARSALGGTGYGLTTVWHHRGGTLGGRLVNGHITNNWYSDYRDVGSNYEATYGTEYQGLRTIPFGLFGFTVNGVRMAVGQLWNRRSATESATVSIVAGPVTADYKRFVGIPTVIWTPEEAWESQDVRMSNFFVDDDRVYIFLSMGVGVAEGAGANKIGVISHVI